MQRGVSKICKQLSDDEEIININETQSHPQKRRPTKFKISKEQYQDRPEMFDILNAVDESYQDMDVDAKGEEESLKEYFYRLGFFSFLGVYEDFVSNNFANCRGLTHVFSRMPGSIDAVNGFLDEWVPQELTEFEDPTKRLFSMILMATIAQINENKTEQKLKDTQEQLIQQTERLAAAQEKLNSYMQIPTPPEEEAAENLGF